MKIHNPPMQFAEGKEEEWKKGLANNSEGYSLAVYRFASEWATLMEKRIQALIDLADNSGNGSSHIVIGDLIKGIAKDASHDADDEGVTGFMYGGAVSILSAWWIHGEELRRWHNLDMQIGDEGEKANESGKVLNPAILNVGG